MSVCAAMMCCTMALGAKYQKVTDISQIESGDVVIFVCTTSDKMGTAFEKTTTYKNTYIKTEAVTITNNEITASNALEFTLGKNGSYWTFTTSDGKKLGKRKSGDKDMALDNGTAEHTIEILSNSAKVTNMDGDGRYIRFQNETFRYYKTTSGVAGELSLFIRTQASDDPIHVESVTLNKTAANVAVGNQTTLTATVLPDNADNKKVTWSSDKESVATVVNGVVTGVAAGTATITATTIDGGKTASCVVTVTSDEIMTTMYRVTDQAKQMTASAQITFCRAEDVTMVMGTYDQTTSQNNIKPITATLNDDGTLSVSEKALYRVSINAEDGSYAFQGSNDKYIYAASTTANQLKAQNAVHYWTVSIGVDDDDVLSVTNTSRGWMRYNTQSNCFSCYGLTSDQKAIVLYSSIPAGPVTGEIDVVRGKSEEVRTYKVMRNGRVEIENNGRRYSILGEKLK